MNRYLCLLIVTRASLVYRVLKKFSLFPLSNAKHGESNVIGLVASSTSKGPQVKTTEPMVSIKVTNCSIQ